MKEFNFKTIATIHNDFKEKFGIPRQSGIVQNTLSKIVFEGKFKNPDAIRGLDGFSHLWLLWIFSKNIREKVNLTVRPPRLGGNERLGVFATRSSFRPNPIALSCVKIEKINFNGDNSPNIIVSGADLMDGTPLIDIKPYLPYTDRIENAKGGFAECPPQKKIEVQISDNLTNQIDAITLETLKEILSLDPRPSYQDNPKKIYGLKYGDKEIHFNVIENKLVITDIR